MIALGVVASCSSDDAPDPIATADGFCAAWAANACVTNVVENCSQDGGSDTACRKSQAAFCTSLLGSGKYHRDAADTCLAYVSKAYSDARLDADEAAVVLKLATPCAQVIGKGGTTCGGDSDCEDGVCEETSAGRGECRLAGGKKCDPNGDLQCSSTDYCNGQNCVERGAVGDTCKSDNECSSSQLCKIVDGATSGTCTPRLATDAACSKDTDCQSGWCSDGACMVRVILTDQSSLCDNLK
jgi:hypothetical protein